jgi:hypothetical protein
MGGISSTKSLGTEFSGNHKFVVVACNPASASDVITLTDATHGISAIDFVIPLITSNVSANNANIYATFSGMNITVVTSNAAGAASTSWASLGVQLLVIGH